MKENKVHLKRGCGYRIKGGMYWTVRLSQDGAPVESFLVDPPVKIDPADFGLSPQNVVLMQSKDGTYHVLDWVGALYYPNVADFIEEVRRYGLSRRCELSRSQLELLTPKSLLICVHQAACIDDPRPYWADRLGAEAIQLERGGRKWKYCPSGTHETQTGDEWETMRQVAPMCAGLWWEDVIMAEEEAGTRRARREMFMFTYNCAVRPAQADGRHSTPAIFAVFPFDRFEVIADPAGGSHEEKVKMLQEAGLSYSLEEE